jgi:O-acetyl-ADP-ribose deacetylase (regulator of RNase III)
MVLALCPVCVLFIFFPDSAVNGNFAWGQASGAVAAYIVIWGVALWRTTQAQGLDAREAAVAKREQQLAVLQAPSAKQYAGLGPQPSGDVELFQLARAPRCRIGLVPGKIEDVGFADVWISSENTNMQMARFYDPSVSGMIRYLGATRDYAGHVVEDKVAYDLAKRRGKYYHVEPGTVFNTTSGELFRTHKVKSVLHVAAVAGEYGHGYKPVGNISACVENSLKCADAVASERGDVKSVLLPLFGTGTGGGDVSRTAQVVLDTVIQYMEQHRRDGSIRSVYILAYRSDEQIACREALSADHRVVAAGTVARHRLG